MGESLTTHTTPATALANSEQTAEPSGRASRFDQRGIALQTVIIMVVLLAIAGSVAAVLLNRGGEASNQLQSAEFGLDPGSFNNATGCRSAGHGWEENNGPCKSLAQINDRGANTDANCKDHNPRWISDPDNANDCKPA